MTDDLGFDIGDLPTPPDPDASEEIADKFDYNVAFNFAFIGVGQCGGRLAHTFDELGYARTCAVNTTVADLGKLDLPDAKKLDLGNARGAGKDPELAATIFGDRDEDLFDFMQRNWGDQVDHAMVCFAAAGGTGAGGFLKTAEVARRYMRHIKRPEKVGAIVALPKDDEGQQYARNALRTMKQLRSAGLSPVIIIDNQKIAELYKPKQSQVHQIENLSTAKLLHLFNRLGGTDSDDTSFDRAEFAKLLDAGVITFAADTIKKWDDAADVSTPIRDRFRRNMLATVDYKTSSMAGLVYVLNGSAYDIAAGHLDHGTAMFTRMLGDGSVVFTGIYKGTKADPGSIKVMAMIAGLDWPDQRILDLAQRAGIEGDTVEKVLGV